MFRVFLLSLLFVGHFAGAQNPHGSELVLDCKACHHSGGWDIKKGELSFDHKADADFELRGEHANTDCISCHETLIFEEASGDCFSCHTDVHQMSVGNDCNRCHTEDNWLVLNIPELHEANGFSVQGNHAMVACVDCHTNATALQWEPIGNECVDCHQTDFNTTQHPNHMEAGFSMDCATCHDVFALSWGTGLNFHQGFPLVNQHDIADCNACHTEQPYQVIPSECVSCHLDDFNNASEPDHVHSGFSQNCTECHDADALTWDVPGFHNEFPLTGVHDGPNCSECHLGNDYSQADSECSSCHMNDYNNAQEPNHVATGYGTDCASCHTTTDADWDIPGFHTMFDLSGVHNVNDCAACHTDPDFSQADDACASCHMDDFNSATDPNHAAQGFSTECALCHTLSPGWSPASFTDHDGQYFPIYSGKHQGEWNQCTDCHTTPNNYTLFSCIDCHEHNDPQDLAGEHNGVSGYVYDSQACYSCHPDGSD